jgi:hypothetical protein
MSAQSGTHHHPKQPGRLTPLNANAIDASARRLRLVPYGPTRMLCARTRCQGRQAFFTAQAREVWPQYPIDVAKSADRDRKDAPKRRRPYAAGHAYSCLGAHSQRSAKIT